MGSPYYEDEGSTWCPSTEVGLVPARRSKSLTPPELRRSKKSVMMADFEGAGKIRVEKLVVAMDTNNARLVLTAEEDEGLRKCCRDESSPEAMEGQ
ncbi:hypothetical protein V6N12_071311 [Hibiscus sabdariffa]|uniref:Uncharacterized protein n=1 Tax=Hibiscus sabdariffa TaxID=183260 RepID=A0ABR2FJH4_9ROSI